jgi:predicted O-linked N-acetylglucosamine transferase (SPINDLY family)
MTVTSRGGRQQAGSRIGGVTRTVNAGLAHHQAGRLERAAALYSKALEKDPDRAEALHLLGIVAYQRGQFASAIVLIERALPELADLPEAHLDLGNALHEAGRPAEAAESYRRAISLAPDYGMAHSKLADALNDQGLFAAGLESSRRGAALIPDFLGVHVNCAAALLGLERFAEAEAPLRRTLDLMPERAETHCDLGGVLTKLGRLDEAVASYRRAVELKPDFVEAHYKLGKALRARHQLVEAIASLRRVVELKPDFVAAHNNLGALFAQLNRLDEAIESYRRAITLRPDLAITHSNLGRLLIILGRMEEAVPSLRRAIALRPADSIIHKNLAAALGAQSRFHEAAASFRRALALDPDDIEALLGLGDLLVIQGKRSEAVIYFGRAASLQPEGTGALAAWFYSKQCLCDWSNYREDEARAGNAFGSQPGFVDAFTLLARSSTPEEQRECARRISARIAVPDSAILRRPRPRPGERIRLGYLSADFRIHPVAFLIAGLIERHDRKNFEIIGYSYSRDDRSAMRTRLINAFDCFVDIEKTPHRQAAELIHRDGVDIVIDLTGYTAFCRPAILAHRPAPIQVNYLGYPGTMGSDFIDYIIVDPFVVPPDQQPFFRERLVYLPDCYQCNDDKREIAELTPSRAKCGLPDEGLVFCCFNNSYKITPAVFDIWMRLLSATPQSVLWLLEADLCTNANLRRETAARGIASDRLVFAPRVPGSEHLARHRLADLFLDTLPYNAHTTASDALWAGLPLLTCVGNTFPGRVAGSLLRAIGLSELITSSLEEYEALALRLAREPEMLARLRARLEKNRRTCPLFDTARFAGNIEAAYRRMWENWKTGKPPVAFKV